MDYQLIVPGSDMHLLLTFSTPLVQIADPMVDLFDAVAGSLTWLEMEDAADSIARTLTVS
ncbi:hypothetical protein [Streptomyces sp. NPDC054804]